jgi:hypothetical protein
MNLVRQKRSSAAREGREAQEGQERSGTAQEGGSGL